MTNDVARNDLGQSVNDEDVNEVEYSLPHGKVLLEVSDNGKGRGAWILNMEVDEEFQNQGIMTRILDKVFADHMYVTPGVIVANHAEKVLGVMQRLASIHNTVLCIEYPHLDPGA